MYFWLFLFFFFSFLSSSYYLQFPFFLLFFQLSIYFSLVIILLLQICWLILPLQVFLRNHVGKNSKQEIQVAWSTLIHHVKWWISYFRGAYRTHTTSEMELFVILVCGFQQIYVTESLVLVLVGILDVPLHFIIISIIYYHFYIIICYYFTPPKIISLVVAVALVWSNNPESYVGRSFSFWQVLPSQAGQRVGCRQTDDRIAGSRARVAFTGRYNLVYSDWELLLFWGENCDCCKVLRPSILKSATERKFSEEIPPVSESVNITLNTYHFY